MQDLPRPEELPPGVELPRPISVTFIPAKVFDNPALLRANPEYYAWLLSLPLLERERLLNGNWKIRPAAGLYFKRDWCVVVDEVPADLDVVRYWDLAATEKTEFNDTGLDGRHQARPREERRLLAIGHGAPARKPGRPREIAARYRRAGRQTGPHRVWPGSGVGRQEPGAPPGARAQRLRPRRAATS